MEKTESKQEKVGVKPSARPLVKPSRLDINVELDKLKKMYDEDSSQESFNLLLLGESGTGKTITASTGRGPILIDSFDPGGTKGLDPEIKSGKVFVDTRWEREDPKNPTAFTVWEKEFDRRL
ncbi:hypothetical protein KAR91_22065, partial [Candidatus Pacearchaeota archaeon]|nr:hypothetical protein [Candidatus Pacearchaeota archaeon]